jgi:hypothetical protein
MSTLIVAHDGSAMKLCGWRDSISWTFANVVAEKLMQVDCHEDSVIKLSPLEDVKPCDMNLVGIYLKGSVVVDLHLFSFLSLGLPE